MSVPAKVIHRQPWRFRARLPDGTTLESSSPAVLALRLRLRGFEQLARMFDHATRQVHGYRGGWLVASQGRDAA